MLVLVDRWNWILMLISVISVGRVPGDIFLYSLLKPLRVKDLTTALELQAIHVRIQTA